MPGSGQQKIFWWLWLVLALVLVLFATRLYFESKRLAPAAITLPSSSIKPAISSLIISPQDPSLGPTQAKLVIIAFADFICPYCAEAAPVLEQFTRSHPDQVRLVWKDLINPGHSQSLMAAEAGQCAARQGKFWEYQRQLFQNQGNLANTLYRQLAQSVGLNLAQFDSCLTNDTTLPLIQFNEQQAQSLGLQETPSIFINGQLYGGELTAESLANLLR